MPGLDGTGPEGTGSLTGRKQGNCGSENTLERLRSRLGRRIRFHAREEGDYQNFGMGRGSGRGFGIRRGLGNRNRGAQK